MAVAAGGAKAPPLARGLLSALMSAVVTPVLSGKSGAAAAR